MVRSIESREHRTNMRKLNIILGLLLLPGCAHRPILCYPRGPAASELVGTWIGFTPEENDFFRIVLKLEGGLLAHSFVGCDPAIYKIDSWSLNNRGKLLIKTAGVSTNAYPITITGTSSGYQLSLKVSANGTAWSREVLFHNEVAMKKRIASLERAMM